MTASTKIPATAPDRPQDAPRPRGRPRGSALPPEQRMDPVVRARVTPAQAEKFARLGGAEWFRQAIDRARES